MKCRISSAFLWIFRGSYCSNSNYSLCIKYFISFFWSVYKNRFSGRAGENFFVGNDSGIGIMYRQLFLFGTFGVGILHGNDFHNPVWIECHRRSPY